MTGLHTPTHRLVARRPRRPAPQDDLFTTAVPAIALPPVEDNSIDARFARFHDAHPEVYRQLVALARELVGVGHQRLGIGMLFEVVRWMGMVARDDEEAFALNNVYRSRYARLIMENEPDLAEVFATRELTSRR